MNDTIAARDTVLARLVSLRNRYVELITQQSARLDAIGIDSVPGAGFVNAERAVIALEAEIVEEFAVLAEGFPKFEAAPGFVVTKVEEKSRWFGIRKSHEVLKEAESPELPEARLQDARLSHLLETFGGDLSARRVALQHASYTIKRAVVGLNQAAAFSPDSDGARGIERDRHGLETLVSMVDRVILDIVILGRRIEAVSSTRVATDMPPVGEDTAASEGEPLMLAG